MIGRNELPKCFPYRVEMALDVKDQLMPHPQCFRLERMFAWQLRRTSERGLVLPTISLKLDPANLGYSGIIDVRAVPMALINLPGMNVKESFRYLIYSDPVAGLICGGEEDQVIHQAGAVLQPGRILREHSSAVRPPEAYGVFVRREFEREGIPVGLTMESNMVGFQDYLAEAVRNQQLYRCRQPAVR